MAGSLAEKVKLKAGMRAALVNAPDGFIQALQPLPVSIDLHTTLDEQFDWIQVFVRNTTELAAVAPRLAAALKPASLLWIAFPKGTSKIQTDLTRDKGWEALQALDLKWINLVSVDDTWSAFSLRPYRSGEVRQSFR